ncbi:MAG: energy-coupling factor ABC transporter ATP-binding protein, partial [Lachnospiraceae bacterium]|nr:energy-coupling factor ABC transporter ATP-binding protein [Lachnospiraceae bacterium]
VEKRYLNEIRGKIGYVFQDSDCQLFMPTVYEDVAFAPKNYGLSKSEVEKRTIDAMKKVGIEQLKDRSIYSLSGGEKKLASIATVLSMQPEILIFDEPTIALDPRNRRRFMETLHSLEGTTIITSHDLDLIYDTCERTILISNGTIIKDGDTKEILRDKELLEHHGLELPLSLSRM